MGPRLPAVRLHGTAVDELRVGRGPRVCEELLEPVHGEVQVERVHVAREDVDLALELGPEGQIHVFTGDMDTFYLNLAVYRLEEFLTHARPPAEADFAYGRPMKPHGWQPWTNADLMRLMALHMERRRPRR